VKVLLTVLPLAFVMVAGPQIISAIFLATSEGWQKNSAAYVLGAALSITAMVTIAYFIAKGVKSSAGSSHKSDAKHGIDIAVIALLAVGMVYVFLKKRNADPPKWMGKLQAATPRFSFTLGFLLLGVFPTDIVTSTSVGARLGGQGEPWWHSLPFIFATLLLLALPSLLLLLLGERARVFLPKARNWMNTNSWVISEVVLVFFLVMTASDL
jgi:hypothetical protein